jgi:hypothetical protein
MPGPLLAMEPLLLRMHRLLSPVKRHPPLELRQNGTTEGMLSGAEGRESWTE